MGWLGDEKRSAEEGIVEKRKALEASTDAEEDKRLKNSIAEMERTVAKMEFRQGLGDYFAFKDESEVPADLVWENGMEEPEIGDPACDQRGRFSLLLDLLSAHGEAIWFEL